MQLKLISHPPNPQDPTHPMLHQGRQYSIALLVHGTQEDPGVTVIIPPAVTAIQAEGTLSGFARGKQVPSLSQAARHL